MDLGSVQDPYMSLAMDMQPEVFPLYQQAALGLEIGIV